MNKGSNVCRQFYSLFIHIIRNNVITQSRRAEETTDCLKDWFISKGKSLLSQKFYAVFNERHQGDVWTKKKMLRGFSTEGTKETAGLLVITKKA